MEEVRTNSPSGPKTFTAGGIRPNTITESPWRTSIPERLRNSAGPSPLPPLRFKNSPFESNHKSSKPFATTILPSERRRAFQTWCSTNASSPARVPMIKSAESATAQGGRSVRGGAFSTIRTPALSRTTAPWPLIAAGTTHVTAILATQAATALRKSDDLRADFRRLGFSSWHSGGKVDHRRLHRQGLALRSRSGELGGAV